jgi:hypothetical protein
LQCHIGLRAFEDGVKVDGIAMDKSGLINSMLEKEVYFLKILEGAPAFKVKD